VTKPRVSGPQCEWGNLFLLFAYRHAHPSSQAVQTVSSSRRCHCTPRPASYRYPPTTCFALPIEVSLPWAVRVSQEMMLWLHPRRQCRSSLTNQACFPHSHSPSGFVTIEVKIVGLPVCLRKGCPWSVVPVVKTYEGPHAVNKASRNQDLNEIRL
jgi:hypothetical protein